MQSLDINFNLALSNKKFKVIKLPESPSQDEKNQVLTTNIWLDHEWKDEMLTWDPALFNGITKLMVRNYFEN